MSAIGNASHGPVSGNVCQIGTVHGSVFLGQEQERVVHLLPMATQVFQNRADEFAELDGWADEAQAGGRRLWNVVGDSGIGKTAFVLTWINENRHRFGHAQIAMDCGGGAGGGHGRGIEEVCDSYFALNKVVTDGHALDTTAAKIDLFRSLVAERPAVLLLDDVQSAAQVRPFLSNVPGLLVIATSRVPLAGLAEARPRRLALRPMAEGALSDLIAGVLEDSRPVTEPGPLAELVRMCAGLPLVASHAAGLLHDRPDLPIGDLVSRMARDGRLSALDDGNDEDVVRPSAVFDVSYAELNPWAAEVYRAIGLHPTRDFEPDLVPALFREDAENSAAGLRELLRRGLVKQDRRGRCLMEDLTYEHAAMRAQRATGPGERARLRERVADYYLYAAVAADTHMSQRWRLGPLYGEPAPFALPDFAAAPRGPGSERRAGAPPAPGEWVGDNLDAILACMERSGRIWDGSRPAPGYCWQMAEATNAYFTANGRGDERAAMLAWAERDAAACENPDAQARVQAQWGEMLAGQGRLDEAEERFRRSLDAAEAGTQRRAVGAALEWLGITERRRGRIGLALDYLERARPLLDPARPRSRALLQMHRADAYAVRGDRAAALECFAAAMEGFRDHAALVGRDHANEGKVLLGQGELLSAERPHQARALMEEALERFRAADRPYQEGKALEALGDLGGTGADAGSDDGGGEAAADHWRAARDLYSRIGNAEAADRVRAKLGEEHG